MPEIDAPLTNVYTLIENNKHKESMDCCFEMSFLIKYGSSDYFRIDYVIIYGPYIFFFFLLTLVLRQK